MLTAMGARPPPALAHRGPLPLSARSPLIQAATRCGLHSLTGSIPPGSPPASSLVRVKPKQQLHLNSGVSQRKAAHADLDDDFRSADRQTRGTDARTLRQSRALCARRAPLSADVPACGAECQVTVMLATPLGPWAWPRTLGQSPTR